LLTAQDAQGGVFPFSVVASSRAIKQSLYCPASLLIAQCLLIIAYCSRNTIHGVLNLWGVSPQCGDTPQMLVLKW